MKRLAAIIGGLITMAALATPYAASAATVSMPAPVTLSGATEVPKNPEPQDGILQGGFCTPDVHVFNKQQTVPGLKKGTTDQNHIVFAVKAQPQSNGAEALKDFNLNDVKVYAVIFDASHQVLTRINLPLTQAPRVDPHTGKLFFVQCVWLHGAAPAGVYYNFPTGKYSYKFVATDTVGSKTSVRFWSPSNNTFTIVDKA